MARNGLITIRSTATSVGLIQLSDDVDVFEQWTLFVEGDDRVETGWVGAGAGRKRLPLWIVFAF